VAQSRHDPAFDDLYRHFGLGLVFGFIGSRRYYGNAVVRREPAVGWINIGLVTVGFATVELKCLDVRLQPVDLVLTPACAGEGVVGGAQHRDEHLGLADLSSVWVHNGHCWSAVINKQLLPGMVNLPHTALLATLPLTIAVTELGVTVTIKRMLLTVFLPQQLFGDSFALEFLANLDEVGFGEATMAGSGLGWEQQSAEITLLHVRRQWPAQASGLGSLQVIGNRAIANVQGQSDATQTESCLKSIPQYVFNFTHC